VLESYAEISAGDTWSIAMSVPNISGKTFSSLSYPPTAAFQQPGPQVTLTEGLAQQGVSDTTGSPGVITIVGNNLNIAETVTDQYGNSVEMDDQGNWVTSTPGSGWSISGSPSSTTSFVNSVNAVVSAAWSNGGTGNAQVILTASGAADTTGLPEIHTIASSIAGVGSAPPASGSFQPNSGGMSCAFDLEGNLVAGNIGTGFGGSSCTGSGNLTSGAASFTITITATTNGDLSDTALSPQAGTAGSGGLMGPAVSVSV